MTYTLKYTLLPFLLLAAAILVISYFILNSSHFAEHPDLFAVASTIDLTLLIPGIYFLFIRKSKIPKITVLPVFVLSMVAAGFLIPADYQQTLRYIQYTIPLIELFVMGSIIYHIQKTFRAYKRQKRTRRNAGFLEAVSSATANAYGEGLIANAFATELSIFHYALFGWRPRPELPVSSGFTYHKENGYGALMAVVAFALVAETVIFHLLLSQWSPGAAWTLTGISLYSSFFLIGDFNAIRKRPIYLSQNGLVVRIGLRWMVTIPYEQIASVELRTPDKEKEAFANFILTGDPNVVIRLNAEIQAKGLYGFKKRFSLLALNMDDKEGFKAALNEYIN